MNVQETKMFTHEFMHHATRTMQRFYSGKAVLI